ncbi:signal transduction histidine kinase [Allocatelliglobosispora scoriae]|uniref:histidine kinase n=1 Tax=Allocatelliglobosispora scoriae TaxID=643052 RepID=A0A841C4U3_9ACTN|nr:HAMP domain-containing sensor histidine kinase [Allocatelliglobosispora scoriae]MBB5873980.1 signal transduction histidine kinase [Allocatelliglobosispora scoriae]
MNHSLRGNLRIRLTVAFSVIFGLAAAAVLAGSMILVRNSMEYSLNLVYQEKYSSPGFGDKEAVLDQLPRDEVTQQQIIDSMQLNLIAKGGMTVLVVWIVATASGWFLAGRLLRPLSRITLTAQRIAGRTLHRRIALDMPPGEVKSLADSFDSMLDRLDEAFAGQGRFIANAAHELKTPIALNRTLVEVAMNRPGSPVEVRNLGENLLAVNQRHERLIDALLTLARADDQVTERRPVDVAELAASALRGTAALAAEHAITVTADLRPAATTGDAILLEQLIRNLVDNAVRYNVPSGRVGVTTFTGPRFVEITVTNTGAEIGAHEVPVLFEPFRRLVDRVGSARGHGLGLSIVRAVAQAHSGDAVAAPNPGGGLSVRVTLPIRW